ncbi:SWIM zinc finger family protein [Acidianus sp. HS-5]|uniref:SWIM zinc finger family protein n=1 Tax=Acidianus sp. HS-5 TaxID=2886040 RepID=UPI001F378460|nr:SWIM zinc finger family protein [Acidianus sp. HS-5]BDC18912.1 hypothetical protein HS5_18020 [Acidianus sp. HS-5]
MYSYAVSERHEKAKDVYIFVVDSEENPLESYIVKIEVGKEKIRASCSCKGFALKGYCKHINISMKKLRIYRRFYLQSWERRLNCDLMDDKEED